MNVSESGNIWGDFAFDDISSSWSNWSNRWKVYIIVIEDDASSGSYSGEAEHRLSTKI